MPFKPIRYQGKDYPSKTQMCRELGIDYHLFIQREQRGLSVEDAVKIGMGELPKRGNPVEFHGVLYPSVKAVAEEYGLSYSRLEHFYYRNRNIQESVQKCIESNGILIELWGHKYFGIAEVALKFGIKYVALAQRVRDGMELQQAVKSMLGNEPVTFRGKQYENFVDLCAEHHIQPGNVYERLSYGFTLEEALERPIQSKGIGKTVSYNGKNYTSLMDLCRDYGISEMCVREQLRRNPLQFLDAFEILVELKKQAVIPREEYLNYIPGCRVRGKNYKTVASFAAEFGMTSTTLYTYKSRHNCGTVFEAFRQMQKEVRKAYLKDGKPTLYSELLKQYDKYQIYKMNLPAVEVPRYPMIQNFDFFTDCHDTLAIYENLLNVKIEQVAGQKQTMGMEGLQ